MPTVAWADTQAPLRITDVLRRRYPPHWAEAWQLTRALLRQLRRDVEHDGARLFVAVLPSAYEVSRRRLETTLYLTQQLREQAAFDADKPTRLLERFLTRRRMPHLTLLQGLRDAEAAGRTPYFGFDQHMRSEGHAVVTELLLPRLTAEIDRSRPRAAAP
jgi:hypothetical protein